MKFITKEIPLFPMTVLVAIGEFDGEQIENAAQDADLLAVGDDLEHEIFNCAAHWGFPTGSLIWFETKPGPGLIAHELQHAILHIGKELRIPIEAEEFYAYLIQFLTEQLQPEIKKIR